MKLSELKALTERRNLEFTVKDWDGNQPDGMYIAPFDVTVEYHSQDLGYSDHPYGEGSARENHGTATAVLGIYCANDVPVCDEEGGKVLKIIKAGTALKDIPGWNPSDADFFQQQAEENAAD